MVEDDHDKEPYVERVTIKDGDYIFTVKNPAKQTTEKKLAQGPEKVDSEKDDENIPWELAFLIHPDVLWLVYLQASEQP